MAESIFLSYSRRDLEAVSTLYAKLRQAGHSVWFDKESLLAGQDWEYEIRKALNEAKLVIICLSSKWVQHRGYVHKELKLALEVMKEIPEGQIHTIPVRLDNCTPPPSLAKLHWVDIFEADGIERLQRALEPHLSVERNQTTAGGTPEIDAYSEFMEDVISKGGLLHLDPWNEGKTHEELAFKDLLRDRWTQSFDLISAKRYDAVIALWASLQDYPHFRIDHPEWSDKPYFRCQIQTAKAHLFMAHVQLGVQEDTNTHMPEAFRLLSEIVTANPYSMKGGAPDRLPAKHAEVQNLNYKDTLAFALEWFRGWGGGVLEAFGIRTADSANLEKRVRERLYEIEHLFQIRGPAT